MIFIWIIMIQGFLNLLVSHTCFNHFFDIFILELLYCCSLVVLDIHTRQMAHVIIEEIVGIGKDDDLGNGLLL
jgi:hypothetical protein